MEISDKLISEIIGVECEFAGCKNNIFKFKCNRKTTKKNNIDGAYLESIITEYIDGKRCSVHYYIINLDTFIRQGIDEWALDKLNKEINVFPMYEDEIKEYYYMISDSRTIKGIKNSFASGDDVFDNVIEASIAALECILDI